MEINRDTLPKMIQRTFPECRHLIPRPTLADPRVTAAAFSKTVDLINAWWIKKEKKYALDIPRPGRDQIRIDFEFAYKHFAGHASSMCAFLRRADQWPVDDRLVAIIDEIPFYKQHALSPLLRQWEEETRDDV